MPANQYATDAYLKLPEIVDGVLKASTFSRREEVKAWEQEIVPCQHTLQLEQDKSRNIESQGWPLHEIITITVAKAPQILVTALRVI